MKRSYIFILLLILLCVYCFSKINSLPVLDENVNTATSEVANQYKRRNDLIPNLVSVVKGYAAHEDKTLTDVISARAKATQLTLSPEVLNNPEMMKKFTQAQGELSSALSKLLAISENYPDLKANQNFLTLQSQLEGTENRIAVARRDLILAIKNYNIALRTFPTSLLAKIFYSELKIKTNFEINNNEAETPKISF